MSCYRNERTLAGCRIDNEGAACNIKKTAFYWEGTLRVEFWATSVQDTMLQTNSGFSGVFAAACAFRYSKWHLKWLDRDVYFQLWEAERSRSQAMQGTYCECNH